MKDLLDSNKVAGAIIIAGVLIAFAILVSDKEMGVEKEVVSQDITQEQSTIDLSIIAPITNESHVRGSSDPLITIYEYSDFECPYCKQFHDILDRIVAEYGGEVRWVYRHYPIENLHTKAMTEAIASECASEMAGPEGFWFFADRFFELSPSNDRTDLGAVFPQIAEELGINVTDFLTCIEEERYRDKVERDLQEALDTGGRGTPWSIIVSHDRSIIIPVEGMYPYEFLAPSIEELLETLR